ncbi:DNA polymerase alpha catalytic subunit [Iris pallida]|uniref:DNA polymerase n=1 Tax=Iris pallida TaxID=29817 RepID=A0AAX6G4U5_IRIPA|nr:DNA polymerase alpha catalytic subunit [Iris pallida]
MVDPAVSTRRTRARGSESAARSEALQRLKSLRRSTDRRPEPNIQIKLSDPIYDSVPESDYAALVARRRDHFGDFIVDDGDDALGYADDGREEDWSNPNGSESRSDSDTKEDSKKDSNKKKNKKPAASATRKPDPDPPQRQRISSMFTSAVFKKGDQRKGVSVAAESIIDDVLAEFMLDEKDLEEARRQRRGSTRPSSSSINNTVSLPVPPDPLIIVQSENKELESEEVPEAEMVVAESNDGKMEVEDEVKLEVEMEKSGKVQLLLNAKVETDKDENVASASDGWREVCREEGNVGGEIGGAEAATDANAVECSEFDLSSDGSLPFYIIDAHEESFGANLGTVYLFGKVKAGGTYHSCCVVVKNMQRCVYAIPASEETYSQVLDVQKMSSGLKDEIRKILVDFNISKFSTVPSKRQYAFERSDIRHGEHCVLKINYSFKDPPLPADLKGEHFCALLGTHSSALELFLIKRKIKGPSWLSISRFSNRSASERVSWCKFEIVVECPKDISSSETPPEVPRLIVAAINLKTIISEKHNTNEIVGASVICCYKAKIDSPMIASEWKRKGVLSHFTVIRKLDGGIFPLGLVKEVTNRNLKAGSNVLALESSERALLNRLMIELHKLDCDVLVGHNISGFDLDVLLHRAQACKVPSSMWSKIGRLKRSVMPKLTRSSFLYGSGASLGIMSCIAGRLLCDTYLCSRDLLREDSYSLTALAKTQLNKNRKEILPHDIPVLFHASETLLQLVEYAETDAWLSLELMFHLSILPLTRQLTNISGNLWGKTLQGARAQRVEYLLLHSFHKEKFIVPDKVTARSEVLNTTKRKVVVGVGGEDADDLNANDIYPEKEGQQDQGKRKKGPSYFGGLVLEPKKGLYDKYILLLDFNSLYPSIIQEFNICFTTVERPDDGGIPNVPSSRSVGVLPKLLKELVQRRRMVKSWLKAASGLKAQQLDIQQQALKLTANSIYGCLGFSNSRFYAKPLAELITERGREILQRTVDLVQNTLNLEVIYGDTDSIMIYSGLDDIAKAKAIATRVIQVVNKNYRCLEIDLDGLYKRMLLLKKKKYAAVKVQFKDGIPYEVKECKGLDMVRRDWSALSKNIGDDCLDMILSGRTCEEVVEFIHSHLMEVQKKIRNGEVLLDKYVIMKTLTKPPEDYTDAKNQPHVQVALRLKQKGYSGCSVGDTISYIICCQQDPSSGSSGIAQRAILMNLRAMTTIG